VSIVESAEGGDGVRGLGLGKRSSSCRDVGDDGGEVGGSGGGGGGGLGAAGGLEFGSGGG